MRLADFSSYRTDEDVELAQFGALKTLLRETLSSAHNTRSAAADARAAAAAAKSMAADLSALCTAIYAMHQEAAVTNAKEATVSMDKATHSVADQKPTLSPVQLSIKPLCVTSAKSKLETSLSERRSTPNQAGPGERDDEAAAAALSTLRVIKPASLEHGLEPIADDECSLQPASISETEASAKEAEGPGEPALNLLPDAAMLQQRGELNPSASQIQQRTTLSTSPTHTRRRKRLQSLQQQEAVSVQQVGEKTVANAPGPNRGHAVPQQQLYQDYSSGPYGADNGQANVTPSPQPSSAHSKEPGSSANGSLKRSLTYNGQGGETSQRSSGGSGGLFDLVSWLTGLAKLEDGGAGPAAPLS